MTFTVEAASNAVFETTAAETAAELGQWQRLDHNDD
jgi:hypothetical protein